jgi:hypothetical protein
MMNDLELTRTPQAVDAIARDTKTLLAALAASKPAGRPCAEGAGSDRRYRAAL